jgi:hypothetical protein
MILDVFLLHTGSPLASALAEALESIGATPLDGWSEGALEVVIGRDAEKRETVLLNSVSSSDVNAIARGIAKRLERGVNVLGATVAAHMQKRRLVMEAAVRFAIVHPDGSIVHAPMPPVDEESLSYEDDEPRSHDLEGMDLRIAASEFGSSALHEARGAARLAFGGEIGSKHLHFAMPASPLPFRLRALADAILAGAPWTASLQSDGRIRVDLTEAGPKRVAFLSVGEHDQLTGVVAKTPS